MRTTQQFSITVPFEMAEMVKSKVASGEYASESEVMRDGLRALLARDKAVEKWLLKEGVAAYDESVNDPSSVLSGQEAKAILAAHHEQWLKKNP